MMSNKWTFSLTSLIAILVLAFVAMPAMALKITPKLATDNEADDRSSKPGYQLEVGGNADVVRFVSDEPLITTTARYPGDSDSDRAAAMSADVIRITHNTSITAALTGAVVVSADGKTITVTLSAAVPAAPAVPADGHNHGKFVTIHLLPGKFTSLTTGDRNEPAYITLNYVGVQKTSDNRNNVNGTAHADADADDGKPRLYYLDRLDSEAGLPAATDTIDIRIVLSEEPKAFGSGQFALTNATFVRTVALPAVDWTSNTDPGDSAGTLGLENLYEPTGRDSKYHHYRLTIQPDYKTTADIKIKVKTFQDLERHGTNTSRREFEIKVKVDPARVAESDNYGTEVSIPNDLIIPAGGALIVAKDDGVGNGTEEKVSDSLIEWPGDPKNADEITFRASRFRTYNIIESDFGSQDQNLEAFLINGGTIDLKSAHDVIISEIMWGTDAGSPRRQWIEIMNTTDTQLKTKDYKLVFYTASETVPVTTTAVAATATTPAIPIGSPVAGVADRVSTFYKGAHWSIIGRGQSGNIAGQVEIANLDVELVPAQQLVSMQRAPIMADGTYPDGRLASSWMASSPPSSNFEENAGGWLVGTPGTAPIISDAALQAAKDAEKAKSDKATADAQAEKDKKANTGTYPMAGQGRVYISEIMFAGGGTLPQWIEISNGDRSSSFNLSGWTLSVDNIASDADVAVTSATFTIPNGTMIDASAQNDTPSTILVVTERGRNSFDSLPGTMGRDQIINLSAEGSSTEVELILAGILKGKYSLLSDMAFRITLAPPVPKATKPPAGETAAAKATRLANEARAKRDRANATDMVGNLGQDGAAAWALPINEEGGRSSIIRKHTQVARGPADPKDGMMEGYWTLASDTAFADVTHIRAQSYYGASDDVGTPGFRAGGALPVELSHFRPTRDKATGQVVITWSTQSELNNAGFFIKRSQQRNGEFKVINATMIAGAGTTSEKQFYTYTDTTAQPNVVYYYQIEDVSLDGNRQTLTRGIRLKGHVGAAGKATTLWGELKTSHE